MLYNLYPSPMFTGRNQLLEPTQSVAEPNQLSE